MKDLSFLKQSLIAHRGIHINFPENSLEAIKEAIKNNYIIEFDVHLLKDNTIIVFHDDNLKRMTGHNKVLKECTYKEIKNLTLLNSQSHIPTLEEVLTLIDGKVPIIIELKYDRKAGLLERQIVKMLDKYKGKFCVKSFNPFSVRWFLKNRPNYIRGLLISKKNKTIKEKLCHSRFVIYFCKPDFISCNYSLYKHKMIIKCMNKIPVIAWTIKSDNAYLKFKDKFYNLICDTLIKK